jgi:sugar phosphate isomerase/epimerase
MATEAGPRQPARLRASIAITPYPGKFAPIPLVGEFADLLPRVAGLGYNAVELHVRRPEDISPARLDALLARCGLQVAGLATGQMFTVEGLGFSVKDPALRAGAVERVNEFARRASDLGAAIFVGYVRGSVSTEAGEREGDLGRMADSLRRCCDFAAPLGVDLLLEPINRYEVNDFHTVDQALAFLREVGRPNLRLLLDTFHMNIEEPSIFESLRAAAPHSSYIHVVDSNRWAPGFGHLDFEEVARVLRETGFRGTLSAEILPRPDGWAGAAQAIQVYRRMQATIEGT